MIVDSMSIILFHWQTLSVHKHIVTWQKIVLNVKLATLTVCFPTFQRLPNVKWDQNDFFWIFNKLMRLQLLFLNKHMKCELKMLYMIMSRINYIITDSHITIICMHRTSSCSSAINMQTDYVRHTYLKFILYTCSINEDYLFDTDNEVKIGP